MKDMTIEIEIKPMDKLLITIEWLEEEIKIHYHMIKLIKKALNGNENTDINTRKRKITILKEILEDLKFKYMNITYKDKKEERNLFNT